MIVTKEMRTPGACSNRGDRRATMKTPAVTMVAAWISADTGVGPSIASGSQVCSMNCADLPIAPMNSSRQATSMTGQSVAERRCEALARRGRAPPRTSSRSRPDLVTKKTVKMPSRKPKSPTRLTTKALMAAALAVGLRRTRSRSAGRRRGRRLPSRRTSARDCRPSPASAWRR